MESNIAIPPRLTADRKWFGRSDRLPITQNLTQVEVGVHPKIRSRSDQQGNQ
jgi:hypothetical protein